MTTTMIVIVKSLVIPLLFAICGVIAYPFYKRFGVKKCDNAATIIGLTIGIGAIVGLGAYSLWYCVFPP